VVRYIRIGSNNSSSNSSNSSQELSLTGHWAHSRQGRGELDGWYLPGSQLVWEEVTMSHMSAGGQSMTGGGIICGRGEHDGRRYRER
jgi:hypothetical protein